MANGNQTPEKTEDKSRSKVKWFERWCGVNSIPARDRLEGCITESRKKLDERIKRLSASPPNPSWAEAAISLLNEADEALKQKKFDSAWRYVLAAQRMEVLGMKPSDDQFELNAIATALREEAETKLRDWRKESVLKLLAPSCQSQTDVSALYRALEIRDEHSNNEYYKIGIRKVPLRNALVLACASVAVTVLLAGFWPFPNNNLRPAHYYDFRMLTAIILFGIMGASLGAIKSLASAGGKIPEQVLSGIIVGMRPILGGAAALGLYAFLRAGFLKLPEPNLGGVLAISFAAGFSEELLIWAVGSISKKGD